jgi:phosphoglycolate phosphatase
MRRLVLFDIDGTILDSGGTAAGAFLEALTEVFETRLERNGYSFAGKTDPQIARDLLTRAGIPPERIDEGLPLAWESYLTRFRESCRPDRVTLLPGVQALIDRLDAHPDAVLGLLTGNLREGARLKLEAAGIRFDRFLVSAFGSDHADRRELPAVAVARAEKRLDRRFEGREIVVIGDTPHDIACGEQLGVLTIAVATGSYGVDDLASCGPDHLFESLEDTAAVLEAIFGE